MRMRYWKTILYKSVTPSAPNFEEVVLSDFLGELWKEIF